MLCYLTDESAIKIFVMNITVLLIKFVVVVVLCKSREVRLIKLRITFS